MPFAHLAPFRAAVPFVAWFEGSRFRARQGDPNVADFMFGNPQELPLSPYVGALTKYVAPKDKGWFAYKLSEPSAQRIVAASLRERTKIDFSPEDVRMTSGGFAAIAAVLRAVCAPGDEVIFLSPPWFFYELLILAANAIPVRVRLAAPEFALDCDAVARAITPKTRAVLVNSPHNPSGTIYDDAALARFAAMLREASSKSGRPIYLLSDEAYYRIAFDGVRAPTPASHYDDTVILYSYGKQTLAPGQRIGYVAVPPKIHHRRELGEAIHIAQCATGFTFPNALLQHALGEIDKLCIDVGALERRRDRLVGALRSMGYETTKPQGTFYLLVRAPNGDDAAFVDRLADRDVFVLPGSIVELPGWIRVSLTATDAMVERALPAFEQVRALGA
jgi:aspartate aminotransferase